MCVILPVPVPVHVRLHDGSIALATICEEIHEELIQVRQGIESAQVQHARGTAVQHHLDADIQQRRRRADMPCSLAISESEYFADDDNQAVMWPIAAMNSL